MTSSQPRPVERVTPPGLVIAVGNPVLSWLLSGRRRSAAVGRDLMLLHVTGRRSGRVYSTPVAYHRRPDGRLLVLTSSGWRFNLRGRPTAVEVTLFGRRLPATAVLVEDPDAVADVYGELIEAVGVAKANRRLGIRINLDRAPTHGELCEAARRDHLSVLHLDVDEDPP
ncbi:MAG: nitroreductase/quinone reductase family protein [Ornithinibacter sp.]